MPALFNQITFIGIGLIGSSIARVIKQNKLTDKLVAFDTNTHNNNMALELGIIDEKADNLIDAVKDADLIMICTPVKTYKNIATAIAPHLKEGVIISDVGSVKSSVIKEIEPLLPPTAHFVPGHPIAGTEKSGPESGFAELFTGRWFIFTPTKNTSLEALDKVSKIWESAGMQITKMPAEHHDKIMAAVSHLPHLIAYTIVGTADDLRDEELSEVIKYSAGGFRDFTRIAGSDPIMWRDIFLSNKDAILEVLQRFNEDLIALQRAIRWDDGETLEKLFTRTRKIRKEIIDAGQHQPENEKILLSQQTKKD